MSYFSGLYHDSKCTIKSWTIINSRKRLFMTWHISWWIKMQRAKGKKKSSQGTAYATWTRARRDWGSPAFNPPNNSHVISCQIFVLVPPTNVRWQFGLQNRSDLFDGTYSLCSFFLAYSLSQNFRWNLAGRTQRF